MTLNVPCSVRKHLLPGSFLLLVTAAAGTFHYFYLDCCSEVNGPLRHRTDVVPTILAFASRYNDELLPFVCREQPAPPPSPETFDELDSAGYEQRGRWHRVDTYDNAKWYVYSAAHIDKRLPNRPLVRIIAMYKGENAEALPLFCRWYTRDNGTSSVTRARRQELWIRSWDSVTGNQDSHYYHPYLLSCPIPESPNDEEHRPPPTSVSVTTGSACDERPTHRLPLIPPQKENPNGFVVCLKPLDFVDRDTGPRLMEWLELQYILGADRVYAYVYRLQPDAWKVLRHYARAGRVVIRNHTLPGADTLDRDPLWQKRRHEMAVYNDCFYRHVHSHAFVVNLDLDEAIVPVRHESWSDLLRDVLAESETYRRSASLSVRNVYFFDSFGRVDNVFILPSMTRTKQDHPRGLLNNHESSWIRGQNQSKQSANESGRVNQVFLPPPTKGSKPNHLSERPDNNKDLWTYGQSRSKQNPKNLEKFPRQTKAEGLWPDSSSRVDLDPPTSTSSSGILRIQTEAKVLSADPSFKTILDPSNSPMLYSSTRVLRRWIKPNQSPGKATKKGLGSGLMSKAHVREPRWNSSTEINPEGMNSNEKIISPSTKISDGLLPPGHLHMLRHVIRSANFTPPGFAQKSFFSTRLAEAVSNHYALRAVRSDVRLLSGLDVDSARLHHYRRGCPPLMERECDENYTRFRLRDTLLWKYADRLVQNVLQRMRELDSLPDGENFSRR